MDGPCRSRHHRWSGLDSDQRGLPGCGGTMHGRSAGARQPGWLPVPAAAASVRSE